MGSSLAVIEGQIVLCDLYLGNGTPFFKEQRVVSVALLLNNQVKFEFLKTYNAVTEIILNEKNRENEVKLN